jgi:hypothetical protein
MNKKDKLNLILKTVKDFNITAYEIGKHTKISVFGVQRILNGVTKSPNERTLDLILDFLEKATLGTDLKKHLVEEPKTDYNVNPATRLEECLYKQIELSQHILYLESILLKNKIDFLSLSDKSDNK